ncbi:YkgJ family cysteine cluster protein [Pseudomonas germanica]
MFPCTKCGLCCRNLDKSPLYASLDRGDGVCVNFEESTHLCRIYDTRPLICRIDDFYDQHLAGTMCLEDYHAANAHACKEMQQQNLIVVAN